VHGLAILKQHNAQVSVARRLDLLPLPDSTIALYMNGIGIQDGRLNPEIVDRLAVGSASC